MQEEIFRALELGATLITASPRLARVMARSFITMRERGQHGVEPARHPADGCFFDRAWSEWLGRWADETLPVLLNPLQEQMLWEQLSANRRQAIRYCRSRKPR